MQRPIRKRITTTLAVIGFVLAMLLGGGAPHMFIDSVPPTAGTR
jgi:hypothetical protein